MPEAVRAGLTACSRRGEPELTRGEMAAVFGTSLRTISRWECRYGLSPVRKNARVLRYELDNLVRLVASGRELKGAEAERHGLNSKAIVALASSIALRPHPAHFVAAPQPVVLVAETEDDRRLLAAWRDHGLGPILRRILHGLTEETATAIN